MPDCWIFLLKRRSALSKVSFSPTRISANAGITSSALGSSGPRRRRANVGARVLGGARRRGTGLAECSPGEGPLATVVSGDADLRAGLGGDRGAVPRVRSRARYVAGRIPIAEPGGVVHDAPVTTTRRTLVDLLEGAAARYGERTALGIRRDDGTIAAWSYRELDRRIRLAAWRLRARGLRPGDRLLTWSASCPELAAVYFGAMRAGLILVPLDLRMSAATIRRIADRSGAVHLAIGTGRDAPDPAEADLDNLPCVTVDDLCADPGAGFPADWEATLATWARPAPRRGWSWPTRTRSRASTGSTSSSRTWSTASCPCSRSPTSSSRRSGSTSSSTSERTSSTSGAGTHGSCSRRSAPIGPRR